MPRAIERQNSIKEKISFTRKKTDNAYKQKNHPSSNMAVW
jgi:hypothetical protein